MDPNRAVQRPRAPAVTPKPGTAAKHICTFHLDCQTDLRMASISQPSIPRARAESTGTLVSGATREFASLAAAEVRLGLVELGQWSRGRAAGLSLLGVAGLVALFALVFVNLALVAGLDVVLPRWAALAITATVDVLAAVAVAALGLARLKHSKEKRPTPLPHH